MDDAFIERLAEKLAKSDQALKLLQGPGPERKSISAEEDMAAVMLMAEAAATMEQVAHHCLQLEYENATREAGQQRVVH